MYRRFGPTYSFGDVSNASETLSPVLFLGGLLLGLGLLVYMAGGKK